MCIRDRYGPSLPPTRPSVSRNLDGEHPRTLEPDLRLVGALAHELGDGDRPGAARGVGALGGAHPKLGVARAAAAPGDAELILPVPDRTDGRPNEGSLVRRVQDNTRGDHGRG